MGLYTVSIIPNIRVIDSLVNSFYIVFFRRISRIFALSISYFLTVFLTQKGDGNQYVDTFFGVLFKALIKSLGTENPDSPA